VASGPGPRLRPPMGAAAAQLEYQTVQCAPCKSELVCGDGLAEYADDDPSSLDGDVKNSRAMTNHKLLKAARDGDAEAVLRMLKKGAYVETRRPFVMTPESEVPSDSGPLKRGKGLTPLMYAAQGGYERACDMLIAAGACVHAADEDGTRPLHFAASSASTATCRVLLRAGADRTARDDDGRLALEHVPPNEMVTPAEKRLWRKLLGQGAETVPEAGADHAGDETGEGCAVGDGGAMPRAGADPAARDDDDDDGRLELEHAPPSEMVIPAEKRLSRDLLGRRPETAPEAGADHAGAEKGEGCAKGEGGAGAVPRSGAEAEEAEHSPR